MTPHPDRKEWVAVKWVPTAKMVADGLTKVLPRQKHEQFVKLLRMEDIQHLVEV